MSITFDPKKWSGSLRRNEEEELATIKKGARLITVPEVQFFRLNPDRKFITLDPFVEIKTETIEAADTLDLLTGGRIMRMVRMSKVDD